MMLRELNSFAMVADRVDVMVLSAAARNVAIQVEMMPAIIAGVAGALSSWRGLYPAVVAMMFFMFRGREISWLAVPLRGFGMALV